MFVDGSARVLVVFTGGTRTQLFLLSNTTDWMDSLTGSVAVACRLVGSLRARTHRLPGPKQSAAILVALLQNRFQAGRPIALREPHLSPADGLAQRKLSGV